MESNVGPTVGLSPRASLARGTPVGHGFTSVGLTVNSIRSARLNLVMRTWAVSSV